MWNTVGGWPSQWVNPTEQAYSVNPTKQAYSFSSHHRRAHNMIPTNRDFKYLLAYLTREFQCHQKTNGNKQTTRGTDGDIVGSVNYGQTVYRAE